MLNGGVHFHLKNVLRSVNPFLRYADYWNHYSLKQRQQIKKITWWLNHNWQSQLFWLCWQRIDHCSCLDSEFPQCSFSQMNWPDSNPGPRILALGRTHRHCQLDFPHAAIKTDYWMIWLNLVESKNTTKLQSSNCILLECSVLQMSAF